MPYTTPLRDIPLLPQQTGAFVDAEGRPTPYLHKFLADLIACLKTMKAALDQLEPP